MKKIRKLCDEYTDSWIEYPGVGKITDDQVADMVIQHTTLFDRLFNPRKICKAALYAQNILMKVEEEPKEKWLF